MLPDPIQNFVNVFAKLPSLGPRQATRLAFYITKLGKERIREVSTAISDLNKLSTCPRCFRAHAPHKILDDKLCQICSDSTRSKKLIAVVEKETDLISLEKTKKFSGWYLVLGELSKVGELNAEQRLRLNSLKGFIKKELSGPSAGSEQVKAEEIILAINPTAYGDLGASFLKKELKDCAQKITRLGRGIPTGGEIEFADEDTLSNALEKRS